MYEGNPWENCVCVLWGRERDVCVRGKGERCVCEGDERCEGEGRGVCVRGKGEGCV